MSTAPTPPTPTAPFALGGGEGEAFWFFGTLVTLKATEQSTGGRFAVIENLAPQGAGSPLHVHRREDEWFFVLEGEITLWVGGEVIVAPAGAFVYGPRDVPHTFLVTSPEARFLIGTEPAGFDGFVRAFGQPAPALTIPPPAEPPADMGPIIAAAAEFGVEIIGPPGIPA